MDTIYVNSVQGFNFTCGRVL